MVSRLKDLVKDLSAQVGDTNEMLDQRHYRLLLNLSALEKHALAKVALGWNWNFGSPIVMKYLQKSNILSMSDLIVNTYNENTELAQLIFNDLLETEYMLLADLLKHINTTDPTGLILCDLLTEGFKRLCNDAIQNPTILVRNYLTEVQDFLQDDCLEEIRLMHLKLLLEDGPKNSIDETLAEQPSWNEEVKDEHVVFKSFLSSVMGDNDFKTRRTTFETVLNASNNWERQRWKFLLLALGAVVDVKIYTKFNSDERIDFKAITKKFLKDTFRRSIDEEDENGFHVLFLVARQITRYNGQLLGDYATWFKDTAVQMKNLLKNAEFSLAMQFLAGMVQLESNSQILDVHINTFIPAAPKSIELVDNYKQLCRSRQLYLNNPKADESIVVEDDDGDADVFLIMDEN